MNFIDRFIQFFVELWDTFTQFILDLFIFALNFILDVVLYVLNAIPSPDFIVGATLGDTIDPSIAYLVVQAGIPEALAIYLSGVIFYFIRRILTLGIW